VGSVRTAFEYAVKATKLDGVVFHTLRHTTASHAIMKGASLSEVADLLGHQSIAMTMRYAHLSPTHRQAAAEKLASLTPVDSAVDPRGQRSAHGHPMRENRGE